MIIIDATTGTAIFISAAAADDADTLKLQKIQERFDAALEAGEKDAVDAVLSVAYEHVGGKIRDMLAYLSKGRIRSNSDEAQSIAFRALHQALLSSGKTAFTSKSAYWDAALDRCLRGEGQAAAEIWRRLSPALKQEVTAHAAYIKQPTIEKFVGELNGMIRDRQFVFMLARLLPLPADSRGIGSNASNLPLPRLTELGAACISAAFPEAAVKIPQQKSSLLGYVRSFSLPRLMQQHWQESTNLSTGQIEVLNDLKPYLGQLAEIEATGLPDELVNKSKAERIYFLYRQGLERYKPSLAWYEQQVKRFQPQNPFRVNSPESLRDAKALLKEHGVPESAMPPVPVRVLKPYSLAKIEKVLELTEKNIVPPMVTRPDSGPEPSQTEDAAMRWLSKGHASPAYKWMIGRLYERGSIENEVGNFLARVPSPTRPQITDFVDSFSEQLEEELGFAGGYEAVSLAIDREVLRKIPEMRPELERAFGTQTVTAAIDSLRQGILLRKAAYIAHRYLKSA